MAFIEHLQGDLEMAERYFTRAEAAGQKSFGLASLRARVCQNLSRFSKSAEWARKVPWVEGHEADVGLMLLSGSGAFFAASNLLIRADLANMSQNFRQLEAMREIAKWVDGQDLDEQISKVLDLAGEMMIFRRLFWLDLSPRIQFDAEMQCPGVRFLLEVTPEEAALMNEELIDKIVEAGLDAVPVTVGFIGLTESQLAETV